MTPEELTEKLLKQLDYIVQQPIAVINSRIVSNTRKFSGQARINTRIGINKPDTQVKLATTYTRDFFTNTVANKRLEFQRMVKDIKLGDVVFTTNSVEYFKHLEDKDLMFFRGVKRYKHEVAKAFRETK